jgi:hypothetical protein
MTCIGKKKYGTMKTAVAIVNRMKARKSFAHKTKRLQAYKCPLCPFWHAGNLQGIRK